MAVSAGINRGGAIAHPESRSEKSGFFFFQNGRRKQTHPILIFPKILVLIAERKVDDIVLAYNEPLPLHPKFTPKTKMLKIKLSLS
jgi:hypothetical protein